MNIWYLRLLSSLQAERDGQIITRFRSHRFAGLLAYLALFPRRAHSREELADLFWPDSEVEVARMNLRTALSSLRRQLELPGMAAGSVLVTEGRYHVRLNGSAITSDVAAFESALAAAARPSAAGEERVRHWTAAVSLYTGPLLPGFYDTWVLTERDRLAQGYQHALKSLIVHYEQTGDTAAALDLARRAVTAEPLLEDAHALVIRLLMATGQKTAAQRQFDQLSRLLEEHLALEPSPETVALLLEAPPNAPVPHIPRAVSPTPSPAETGTSPSLVAETGTAHFPETTREPPLRIPITTTRFFGRASEMAALQQILGGTTDSPDAARIVTLTGPGGTGKTRLAMETARSMTGFFSGGIWFVGLADIREPAQVPDAIAETLSVVRAPATAALDQAVAYLNERENGPLLLVLDNYEQLVDKGGGAVVWELISRVPRLTCLITSRQRLLAEGEREFPLPMLPVPLRPGTPARLLEFPSVQIFVDRARSARPDFQLSARNCDAVAALCLKLEGIPLALELAAAWAETLTPVQMLERLQQRRSGAILATRRRDIPGRHATLRATVEWSYDLLPAESQRFFRQLSVFHGGWTLDAAEAVLEEPDALRFIGALRERSLVLAEELDSRMRFRMLETLREFAEERQREDAPPDENERLRHRHAVWGLELAEQASPHLAGGTRQAEWLDQIQTEQDNLRAALDYFLAHDAEAELRLATALFRFWQVRGPIAEAQKWLERGLEQGGENVPPVVRARALECAGTLAWYRSDLATATARLEESMSVYRRLGDERGLARAINSFAGMQNISGNPGRARELLEGGITELTARGGSAANAGRQILLESLTRAAVMGGDSAAAERYGSEWLALAQKAGDNHQISAACLWLGYAATNARDYAEAHLLLSRALAAAREVSQVLYTSSALWGLGYLALFNGDIAEADDLQREALRTIAGVTGYDFAVVYIMEALALIARAARQMTRSARLLGVAHALRQRLGYPLAPVLRGVNLEEAQAAVRSALGDRSFRQSYDAGAALPPEMQIKEGLVADAPSAVALRV